MLSLAEMFLMSTQDAVTSLICRMMQTVYGCLHCTRHGELRKLTEVVKMPNKTRYVGSRSFKVIEIVINRKGTCDFLLAINNNLGRISHIFQATVTHWS